MSAFWNHAITVAATTAAIGLLRAVFAALMREPARALMTKYWVIEKLSKLWPIKHPTYSGNWQIEWQVDESPKFPSTNQSTTQLHKFLHFFAAETEFPTTGGKKIKYGFVGKLNGPNLTGNWFDCRDPKLGYYGPFQIKMASTMDSANGKRIGFSDSGVVKAGDLIWKKL